MRRYLTATSTALILGSILTAPAALAQPVCGAHDTVSENLKETYAEAPISMSLQCLTAAVPASHAVCVVSKVCSSKHRQRRSFILSLLGFAILETPSPGPAPTIGSASPETLGSPRRS